MNRAAILAVALVALATTSAFTQPGPEPTPVFGPPPKASQPTAPIKAGPFGPVALPQGAVWNHATFALLGAVGESIRFRSPSVPEAPEGLTVTRVAGGFALTPQRLGHFSLRLLFPKNVERALEVDARLRAGRIPTRLVVPCSTAGTGGEWQRWVYRALLGRLQPAARLSLSDLGATPTAAHRQMVVATGPGMLSYQGAMVVDLQPFQGAPQRATALLLSNRPEKVHGPELLLSRQLELTGPTRLMVHHKLMSDAPAPADLELRLTNTGEHVARVQLALELVGPSNDEIFAGHLAIERYLLPLLRHHEQASSVLDLVPGQPTLVERYPMHPGLTVSGYGLLTPLDGQTPLKAEVAVRQPDGDFPTEVVPYDSVEERTSRGFFPAGQEASYTHRAGTPYLFVEVGDQPYARDAATHEQNVGNFGVLQQVELDLVNPSPEPREFRLEVSARGGPARGYFLVDGHLLESGNLSAGGILLERWTLEPGAERRVQVETLPQAGSNYPVTLTVGDYAAGTGPPRDPGQGTDLTFLP